MSGPPPSPRTTYTQCSETDCTAQIPNHGWGRIKADGWFFQKDGPLWCPEHVPGWVDEWRARKAAKASK